MNSFKAEKSNMELMYSKYADLLYRLALSHLQSAQDAEDAVQDVFMKYISAMPRFADENHEKGWFVRVTVNVCRDRLRKMKHRAYVPLEDVHNLAQHENTDSGIFELIEKLAERYKTVIVLHYLEGYSVEEISELLKISASAVKMRLSRGRDILKKEV